MATETNNSDQQTENTMTTDSNHPDPKSESTMNPDDVDTNQNADGNEVGNTDQMVEQCRLEIVEAWGGSVEAVIKTGQIIIKAKAELGGSFTQLEEVLVTLGFKRTVLSYLCTISNNPVLSLPENRCRLPSAYNTLYQLTFVPDEKLAEFIKDGTVTPSTTLEEAKLMRPWPTRNIADKPEDEGIPLALKSLSPESRELFFEELSAVAKKHGVIVSDTKGGGALADWRRKMVQKQALEGIEATKGKLGDGAYERFLMLHGAAIEVSNFKGRQPCLPKGYKDFDPLVTLLSTEDITKARIERYCKDNKMPNPLGDQARVQHEVYVWEQVRLIAEREDKEGALKRLKVMASDADNPTIRALARRVLEDIAGFEPKAAAKKKDLASYKGVLDAA